MMPENTKRVLVVDDEEDVRLLVQRLLEKNGYAVDTAADGEQALAAVAARRPDLIVLDLALPMLDGWGVMERLHAQGAPPPIVLLATPGANAKDGPFRECVAAYLAKPLHGEELAGACRRILHARSTAAEFLDRRQEGRRRLIVKVILLSKGGAPVHAGRLVDLSRHGLQMEMPIELEQGDPVRILLHMPGPSAQLELEGFVRWRNPVENGFAYGIDLSRVTATAARLLHAAFMPPE
jgi:CheY-like chemotaxis protein